MNEFYKIQLECLQSEIKINFNEIVPIELIDKIAKKYETTNYDQLQDVFYEAIGRGEEILYGLNKNRSIMITGLEQILKGDTYTGEDTTSAKIDKLNEEELNKLKKNEESL